jgi:cytosine deaminase
MANWSALLRDLRAHRRGYRLAGGLVVTGPQGEAGIADVAVGADGRIRSVGAAGAGDGDLPRLDASGLLIGPGFVDAHQHLDKTGLLNRVFNPSGTLQGAREAFADWSRRAPPGDVGARAARTMRRCLAHGTTAIRSHVNIDEDCGLAPMRELAALRAQWADRMTLQLVAFPTPPYPGESFDWLEAHLDEAAGMADAMGGVPAMSDQPARYLDLVFETAARHDLPVDLHLDEHLDASRPLFGAVFERVRRFGLQGRVVLSHACVLSALDDDAFARIRDAILDLDLGVITLPAANLYIQGRGEERLPPRGLTRVAAFLRAGVALAAASDNIQDPFVPTGSGDLVEIARWTLLAGHLGAADLGAAYGMITAAPARLMGLGAEYGIRAGARADLVIAECEDARALIAGGAERMIVIARGAVVAPRFEEEAAVTAP